MTTVKTRFFTRLACLLLGACLILFSSCELPKPQTGTASGDEPTDPDTSSEEEQPSGKAFTIAMYNGEAVDPYRSVNVANRNLVSLCFDGLVAVDSSYNASPLLADYSFDESGLKITFQLKDSAVFSDGSPVTASDCGYSFDLAAKEGSVYASVFEKYISGWKVISSSAFEVTLKSANPCHINLFTVPIVKKGSSSDFIGSGRYRFSYDESGKRCLEHYTNPLYGGIFRISRVQLLELDRTNGMYYNFNYGVIHAAYADLSEGLSHYKGNIELVSFPSSTFVFAVANFRKDYLRSADAVRGISYCINRTDMGKQLFDSVCDTVWQPFNPSWSKIAVADLNADIYSTVIASDYFNAAGYKVSGTNRLWGKEPLTLKIVCNNEDLIKVEAAKYIASSLRSMGIGAEVVQYNWENYKKAVASGDFDLYLGKVSIPANMDISVLFSSEIVNSGKQVSSTFSEKLNSFYRGDIDAREMTAAFSEEMPFIPLYYTRGALAVNRLVSGNFSPSESNAFNGIENWVMK